jgi:flagellar M-ring protein FliF
VVNIPFRTEPVVAPEALPTWKQPWLLDLVRSAAVPAALVLVALLLVYSVIKPALRKPPPQPAAPQLLDTTVGREPQLPAEAEAISLPPPRSTKALDDARALAKQNPAAVADIVRGWVSGEAS